MTAIRPPSAVPPPLGEAIAAAGIEGTWLTPGGAGGMPTGKGAYVLALRLDIPARAQLPRRAPADLGPGWYLYLGSARGPGGLGARIGRHFRREKPKRWHVDWLSTMAGELAALAVEGGSECDLTAKLLASGRFSVAAPGFGSSDCRTCDSHLLAVAPLA